MGLLNFILNIAALLLWVNWLSVRTGTVALPYSLAGTLKKAGTSFAYRWKFLLALVGLLVCRALVYWQIGAAINWQPQIHLVVANVFFKKFFLGPLLLFSCVSFIQTLAVFYLSLLLLSILNQNLSDADAIHRLVRLHLGWCEKLPRIGKVILPLVFGGVAWWALHPALLWVDSVARVNAAMHVYLQALLLGVSAYLAWKYLIAAFLFLYLLNSYVYVGNHPLWNYVNVTSRKLIAPIRWLPLRYGRVDFAPVLIIGLVFFIGEMASLYLKNFFPA
jgi:uncharacterized protein YggT (Ycf19 family)